MKRLLLTLGLGLCLVFSIASTSNALSPSDYGPGAAAGDMLNTRHNLGAYGVHFRADNTDGNGGTTEVCIFCHTPHHGATLDPIWNRGVQPTTYTAYGTTIGGTVVLDSDIGSATLACLSCHDGVNSFDTIVNAPGKGNNGSNNTLRTDMNWTFTDDNDFAPSRSVHPDKLISVRLVIGTDLTNDHPVSVPYRENIASLRPVNTVISDILMTLEGLTIGDNDETNSRTTISNRWVTNGFVNTSATIASLLRTADNRVECASCHDPHFNNKSWEEVDSTWVEAEPDTDGMFLRRIGGNSLSGVCRTCHAK